MQFTLITTSYANPSCLLADGRASGSSMNNLNQPRNQPLNQPRTTNPPATSAGGSSTKIRRPPSRSEVGLRACRTTNPPATSAGGSSQIQRPLEVVGQALGLSNYKALESEVKIERMQITRLRDALERSRYAQMNRVCETSITAPGVLTGGTGPDYD